MTKEYKSLEHSIRMIMEGNHLEEKVGPRPKGVGVGVGYQNANNEPSATINPLDFVPIVGTARSAKDAYDAFASGDIKGGVISTGLTALSGLGDLAILTGVGAPVGAALKGAASAGKVAKVVDVASDVAKAADTAADVARAADAASDVAKAADAARAADAASDAALIRRVTSGKNKGKGADTPPPANTPEVQGNLALNPKPLEVKPTKTDNNIEVPAAANQPGAPGTNVVGLPQSRTTITPANPNTRVATPGQAPANLNVPTVRPTAPTTNVRTPAAANQPAAPSRAAETPGQPTTVTRTADDAAPAPTTRRVAEPEAAPAPSVKTEPEAAPAPSLRTEPEATPQNKPREREERPQGRNRRRRRRDLDLFLAGFKPAMDNQSAAGQASGVGTFMHKAGAPLKVSEENEADKARTSIENVARLNSRRDKAVKQQEIQKKILDEKRSLADTVKRNVEETRAKQKMESPIITNPELKRPEPEGVNNVR